MTFAPLDIVHWRLGSPVPPLIPSADGRGIQFYVWGEQGPIADQTFLPSAFPLTHEAWASAIAAKLAKEEKKRTIPVDSGSPRATSANVTISVIICTRDRADSLAIALERLTNCSPAPHEIVVVDNGSQSLDTQIVSHRFSNVTYVREDRAGLDIARNTGVQSATGDILAFTDDDVQVTKEWIARINAAFEDQEIDAITGIALPSELETLAQWIFESCWGFHRGYHRRDFGPDYFARHRRYGVPAWEIGAGANMAFRRRVFEQIGYFDVRLDVGGAGCSGDSEYWYRMLAAGMTCRYDPSVVVYHRHRDTMNGLQKQLYAYMRGHVAALLVQFERHGHFGNLVRLGAALPKYYARRIGERIRFGPNDSFATIQSEITGCLAGIVFYIRSLTVDRRRWKMGRTPCSRDKTPLIRSHSSEARVS